MKVLHLVILMSIQSTQEHDREVISFCNFFHHSDTYSSSEIDKWKQQIQETSFLEIDKGSNLLDEM